MSDSLKFHMQVNGTESWIIESHLTSFMIPYAALTCLISSKTALQRGMLLCSAEIEDYINLTKAVSNEISTNRKIVFSPIHSI